MVLVCMQSSVLDKPEAETTGNQGRNYSISCAQNTVTKGCLHRNCQFAIGKHSVSKKREVLLADFREAILSLVAFFLPFPLSPSLSLFSSSSDITSLSVSVCLSLSFFLSLSLSLTLCHSHSVCLCDSLSLFHSLCLSLSPSCSVCLSLTHSLFLTVCLSRSLCLTLPLSVGVCMCQTYFLLHILKTAEHIVTLWSTSLESYLSK